MSSEQSNTYLSFLTLHTEQNKVTNESKVIQTPATEAQTNAEIDTNQECLECIISLASHFQIEQFKINQVVVVRRLFLFRLRFTRKLQFQMKCS